MYQRDVSGDREITVSPLTLGRARVYLSVRGAGDCLDEW